MNKLLKAPRDEAASAPTQGQANPPRRILVVNNDTSIGELGIAVLVRSSRQVHAAEALDPNTRYRYWGINE